jgi:hypothetical protein
MRNSELPSVLVPADQTRDVAPELTSFQRLAAGRIMARRTTAWERGTALEALYQPNGNPAPELVLISPAEQQQALPDELTHLEVVATQKHGLIARHARWRLALQERLARHFQPAAPATDISSNMMAQDDGRLYCVICSSYVANLEKSLPLAAHTPSTSSAYPGGQHSRFPTLVHLPDWTTTARKFPAKMRMIAVDKP